MQRVIHGFHQDARGDWVAELECGHQQHQRHQPPFQMRQWVLVPSERSERIGQLMECPLCARRELPSGYAPYRRTPAFRMGNIPEGLLRRHSTKPRVWALLQVAKGELEFVEFLAGGEHRVRVKAGERAIIRPGVEHCVVPLEGVEFSVEFWARANAAAAEN